MSNDKNRAAMAAHLCDLAGIAFRCGDVKTGTILAARAAHPYGDENDYRWSLKIADHMPEQIDAAVAAIADGKPPPTSLPARVAKMRNSARREAGRAGMSDEDEWHRAGTVDTATRVLEMLGVTP